MKDQLTSLLRRLPHTYKFVIPMVATSTDEVWVDINTFLRGSDGWHIVEVAYGWESIDPTTPLAIAPAANVSTVLQIHRNQDNELLLNANDDDVLFNDQLMFEIDCAQPTAFPRRVPVDIVTTQRKLRALFRTSADFANISVATVQMFIQLKYHQLNGPKSSGHTKVGKIGEF